MSELSTKPHISIVFPRALPRHPRQPGTIETVSRPPIRAERVTEVAVVLAELEAALEQQDMAVVMAVKEVAISIRPKKAGQPTPRDPNTPRTTEANIGRMQPRVAPEQ